MGGWHQFGYNATGLRGKRMRVMTDLPTNDAGDPQQELLGHTDVISLDDAPSVLHSLRVPRGPTRNHRRRRLRSLAVYDDAQ